MKFLNESIYGKWKVYILFALEYVLLMLRINIIVEISFQKTPNFALNFDKAFDEFSVYSRTFLLWIISIPHACAYSY